MNNYNARGFGTHTVRFDLQVEEYRGTIVTTIGGNLKGGNLLDFALSFLKDEWVGEAMLINPDGYELVFSISDESYDDVDELMDAVVGVRILDWEPEKK